MAGKVSDDDYARLLQFRSALRRFEHWSEQQARGAGLTGTQHQLLLAVRGHSDPRGPTVRELADYLALRHHSVVELIDRTAQAGLVRRCPDSADRRVVRVLATARGTAVLKTLTRTHLEELARIAPAFEAVSETLDT